MKKEELYIKGVFSIQPEVYSDHRGSCRELWTMKDLEGVVDDSFYSCFTSKSKRNVLRGLHYQAHPDAQGKLVWVTKGHIYDVAVDLRPGSDTYGTWVIEGISSDAGNMLWIPPGFAHGFIVDSEEAEVSYLITGPRVPSSERVIRWNDPKLNITWPLGRIAPILSDRDANAPLLDELPTIQRSTW